MENNEQFNPDLLKVMQEAETTKEDDLKKVKEEVVYNYGVPEARLKAEQFYEEELAKTTDITRRHEVSQEKETWIACYMAGYNANQPPAEAERGKGAVWVKASERLPGWRKTVRWKLDGVEIKPCDVLYMANGESPAHLPNYEWLDESGEKDDWISVEDQLPTEGGRYWCYVEEVDSLGVSHFQWNCAYNETERRFSDSALTNGEKITHWRKLPAPPKRKEVPNG